VTQLMPGRNAMLNAHRSGGPEPVGTRKGPAEGPKDARFPRIKADQQSHLSIKPSNHREK
jgi:hypothetical protein